MASCRCDSYNDLNGQASLNKRGADTKRILGRLQLIIEHPGGEHRLYKCPVCDQTWQRSLAWVRGNKPYIFKVPGIEIADWLQKPFVQPDELFARVAHIQQYLEHAIFEEQPSKCQFPGCGERSIIYSVLCAFHHMHNIGIKAEMPDDYRWFGPYNKNDYEFTIEQLKQSPNYKHI